MDVSSMNNQPDVDEERDRLCAQEVVRRIVERGDAGISNFEAAMMGAQLGREGWASSDPLRAEIARLTVGRFYNLDPNRLGVQIEELAREALERGQAIERERNHPEDVTRDASWPYLRRVHPDELEAAAGAAGLRMRSTITEADVAGDALEGEVDALLAQWPSVSSLYDRFADAAMRRGFELGRAFEREGPMRFAPASATGKSAFHIGRAENGCITFTWYDEPVPFAAQNDAQVDDLIRKLQAVRGR